MTVPMCASDSSPVALNDLARRINEAVASLDKAHETSLARAYALGELLYEAKQTVKHGRWLVWLKENCPDVGKRQVQKYLKLAANRARIEALPKANCDALLVASIDGVLALLKDPKPEPEPAPAPEADEGDEEPEPEADGDEQPEPEPTATPNAAPRVAPIRITEPPEPPNHFEAVLSALRSCSAAVTRAVQEDSDEGRLLKRYLGACGLLWHTPERVAEGGEVTPAKVQFVPLVGVALLVRAAGELHDMSDDAARFKYTTRAVGEPPAFVPPKVRAHRAKKGGAR